MDFSTIGTIGSYVKQKNLMFAANYKIKTGQRVADANGNLISTKSSMFDQLVAAQKKTDEQVKTEKLSRIKQKLMSGRKLSETEMSYLRDKDPSLYKKAKHADESREELKAELKKVKTKQEAREAITRAMVKASAEAASELAAYKNGISANAGGVSGVNPVANTDMSGDVSSVNSATEGEFTGEQSLTEVNENVAEVGEEFTEKVSAETNAEIKENKFSTENPEKISDAENEKKNIDGGKGNSDSPDSILEKFIMTIRALEDEWSQFTKSEKYEKLPEGISEVGKGGKKKVLYVPKQNVLDMISLYRKSMYYAG